MTEPEKAKAATPKVERFTTEWQLRYDPDDGQRVLIASMHANDAGIGVRLPPIGHPIADLQEEANGMFPAGGHVTLTVRPGEASFTDLVEAAYECSEELLAAQADLRAAWREALEGFAGAVKRARARFELPDE